MSVQNQKGVYEVSFDCNTDSEDDCDAVIDKFDSIFPDDSESEDEDKIAFGDSVIQEYIKKNIRKPFNQIWKEWALRTYKKFRNAISDYNAGNAFFYINVAGYYGRNGDSGIGVIIRTRTGVPIAACSEYKPKDMERVSPLYQEMRAANKGIDMAIDLNIKYFHIVCTSTEASYVLTCCDRGGPSKGGLEDKKNKVYNLSWEMIKKLRKRRDKYQKEDDSLGFYFSNFACGKIDNTAARFLARLPVTKEDMGLEELSKLNNGGLMDVIFKDATGRSEVGLYQSRIC